MERMPLRNTNVFGRVVWCTRRPRQAMSGSLWFLSESYLARNDPIGLARSLQSPVLVERIDIQTLMGPQGVAWFPRPRWDSTALGSHPAARIRPHFTSSACAIHNSYQRRPEAMYLHWFQCSHQSKQRLQLAPRVQEIISCRLRLRCKL